MGSTRVGRVYAVWGRHPRLYAAQDWVTFLGRHRAIRRRAAAATRAGLGERVLEVACGTGRDLGYLEDRVGPEGEIVGFDYSPEMLAAAGDLARRRGWANVSFVEGDAARLEVGDAPFDAVLSVLGMSAIPDHRAALSRCYEVLRTGGVLSVCDAMLPGGAFAVTRPAVRAIYGRLAAWNPNRDLPGDIRRIFGNVTVTEMNLGTFFVATAVKG